MTRVDRTPHLMRRLAAASVWAQHGVPVEDRRYRGLYRWVLPLTDVFFVWFGVAGWHNGIASVQDATSPTWQTWWSAALAVAAFLALVGVAFPRLWALELIGKVPLVGLVSVYVVILIARGFEDSYVAATGGLVCILILLPVWRIADLRTTAWGLKRRRRRT